MLLWAVLRRQLLSSLWLELIFIPVVSFHLLSRVKSSEMKHAAGNWDVGRLMPAGLLWEWRVWQTHGLKGQKADLLSISVDLVCCRRQRGPENEMGDHRRSRVFARRWLGSVCVRTQEVELFSLVISNISSVLCCYLNCCSPGVHVSGCFMKDAGN